MFRFCSSYNLEQAVRGLTIGGGLRWRKLSYITEIIFFRNYMLTVANSYVARLHVPLRKQFLTHILCPVRNKNLSKN